MGSTNLYRSKCPLRFTDCKPRLLIERRDVKKSTIVGYVATFVGLAIWAYGYFVPGHPPVVDWRAYTPWWIADCMPNFESEIGMAVMLISTVPIYWPGNSISR
jgi:hypothetical protein